MSLKEIFNFWSKNDESLSELKKKITQLEERFDKYQALEASIRELQEAKKEENLQPPIVVERLNVERIIVDKVELNNNFGQLGIKEMKGKLNIGANYGEGILYNHLKKEADAKDESSSERYQQREKVSKGPKVNVRSR